MNATIAQAMPRYQVSDAFKARIRALPFSTPEQNDQPHTMGWGSVINADRMLRAIGGVTEIRRYKHEEGGSYYGVIWWYRGGRYAYCDYATFTRWIYERAKMPIPAWVLETERNRVGMR